MDAKAACEAGGSELARVESQAQQDCLVDGLSSVSFSLNWMSMNGQTDLNGKAQEVPEVGGGGTSLLRFS